MPDMPIEKKVAWAVIGAPALGMLMWGLQQWGVVFPTWLIESAIIGGAIGLLISAALWCHIAWQWLHARGFKLWPALVIAFGIVTTVSGIVWAFSTQGEKGGGASIAHLPEQLAWSAAYEGRQRFLRLARLPFFKSTMNLHRTAMWLGAEF